MGLTSSELRPRSTCSKKVAEPAMLGSTVAIMQPANPTRTTGPRAAMVQRHRLTLARQLLVPARITGVKLRKGARQAGSGQGDDSAGLTSIHQRWRGRWRPGRCDWRRATFGARQAAGIEGHHGPVHRDDLEMTGQVHTVSYLKKCRGASSWRIQPEVISRSRRRFGRARERSKRVHRSRRRPSGRRRRRLRPSSGR